MKKHLLGALRAVVVVVSFCCAGPALSQTVTISGTLDSTAPTFNRSLSFAQGGTCTLSTVGTAVRYVTRTFTLVAPANVTISAVAADGASITPAQADTFLMLYSPAGFNPAATCTNAIAANDDAVGVRSRITTTTPLAPGTYTVVLTSFDNVPAGAGALPWTFSIPVTSPGFAVPPTLNHAPAPGTPVNFTGVGAVGSSGAGQIVVTPSGGAGTGAPSTTTLGTCTLGGAEPGFFAGASAVNLSFVGNTTTPQNIALTCTAGAAVRTATLTCSESAGGGAAQQRSWPLSCPPGALVPLTSVPASGATVVLPSATVGGASTTAPISFSNPNVVAAVVTCTAPGVPFTVDPLTINVPAGGTAAATVRFAPTTPGTTPPRTLTCSSTAPVQTLTFTLAGGASAQSIDTLGTPAKLALAGLLLLLGMLVLGRRARGT